MPATLPRDFSRHPLILLAVSLSVGILATNLVDCDPFFTAGFCLVFAAAAFVFRKKYMATVLIAAAFAGAGAISLTTERLSVSGNRIKVLYDSETIASGSPVEIEGVLTGAPEQAVEGEFLTLTAEKIRFGGQERTVSGSVRVFVQTLPAEKDSEVSDLRSEISNLRYGSRVRVACRLEREDEFLNPGVLTRREILDRQGIDAIASVKSRLLIEHLSDESVFFPLAWVYDQRARLIDEFRRHLSPRAAGVMIASLLGNKHFLDKDTADLFRDGGTFHILVISGLHITFIGGLLLLVCRQVTRNRWTQFVVTVVILWAYTLAVGADVPVVRAAIMFTVLMYSYAIYRRGSLLNSLGGCALVLLVWRPSDLFNPSFQLTFVSVAAIVAFAYSLLERLREIGSWAPTAVTPFPPNVPTWLKRFCETIYWSDDSWRFEGGRQIWTARLLKSPLFPRRIDGIIQKAARYLFEGLLISLIVQIWMLPLSVIYFHRVSMASILLNLWVGVLIALESFAAVAGTVALYFSGFIAAAFFFFAEILNWLMLAVPRLFSEGGWASFRLPAYTEEGRSVYVLYFVPILLLAFLASRWNAFALKSDSILRGRTVIWSSMAALALCAAVIVFHPLSVDPPDGRLHIDFLDVGQGDSAFITFPDGRTMLVDGGGQVRYRGADDDAKGFEPDNRGIGEAVVSEVLWSKGHSRVDHILATHADADHVQGLTDVAKNFTVGSAIFGRTRASDADFAALVEVLRRRGIPVETVWRGENLRFGDVRVEVLYPIANDDRDTLSDNDSSVVLRFVFGSRAILLTGDVERAAEETLISNGGTLAADVVKVAHHGSRTSSIQQFVDSVSARYAIISAGRSSPFGHPHAEVVQRWKERGADVLTTGMSGMISVSTDGHDLVVEKFVPEK